MRVNKMNQMGETIVEVLISIAMLALAIVGSIVVARDSLLIGQSANERTQAFRIAETQIERLKARASTDDIGEGIFSGVDFCVADDLSIITSLPATPASCANSYFPDSNLEVRVTYYMNGADSIASNFDDNLFVVSVGWDNVNGDGRDSVVVDYRLHPLEL